MLNHDLSPDINVGPKGKSSAGMFVVDRALPTQRSLTLTMGSVISSSSSPKPTAHERKSNPFLRLVDFQAPAQQVDLGEYFNALGLQQAGVIMVWCITEPWALGKLAQLNQSWRNIIYSRYTHHHTHHHTHRSPLLIRVVVKFLSFHTRHPSPPNPTPPHQPQKPNPPPKKNTWGRPVCFGR
jgi:hypothetical protein